MKINSESLQLTFLLLLLLYRVQKISHQIVNGYSLRTAAAGFSNQKHNHVLAPGTLVNLLGSILVLSILEVS